MQKFHAGDTAYLVESNNFIREVQIKRRSGEFWLIVYDEVQKIFFFDKLNRPL